PASCPMTRTPSARWPARPAGKASPPTRASSCPACGDWGYRCATHSAARRPPSAFPSSPAARAKRSSSATGSCCARRRRGWSGVCAPATASRPDQPRKEKNQEDLMLKKRKIVTAVAAALLSTTLVSGVAQARISIGSNPQGSVYYVVGGGLAKLLTQELKTQAVVQPYAGASVYLPLVQEQEVTFGISSSLDSGRHYRGEDATRLEKLRTIARLWSLPYAF